MRIANLHLQNFRGHRNLDLPLSPVTIITGPNGSGKSSIQQALEWLLSGCCSCTNERGQGPVIYAGARECSVTARLPNSGTITRSNPHGLSCSWAPNHKRPEVAIAQELGCDGSQARLALNSGRYFRMSAADRKGLLYDLLGLHLSADQVRTELELLPDHDAPKVAAKVVGAGLGDLERAYKAVYGARTEANRQVKDLSATVRHHEEAQSEAIYLPEAEIQAILDENKRIMAHLAELEAEFSKWNPRALQNVKQRLEPFKQPNADGFCANCGFPTPQETARAKFEEESKAQIARIEAEGPGRCETIREQVNRLQEALAENNARLQAGQQQRESQTTMANYRTTLEQQTRLAATLDMLCDLFGGGPGGLMHRMLRPRIEQFADQVNAVAAYWGLRVSYSPALLVEVSTPNSDPVPYEALSDGEQILVALAHQVAISRRLGLGIVVVDRIEALDAVNQAGLYHAALELASLEDGLDHVILMGVRADIFQALDEMGEGASLAPGVGLVDLDQTPLAVA